MKLKNSGSISDSEQLNFLEEEEEKEAIKAEESELNTTIEEQKILPTLDINSFNYSPFKKELKDVTIFSISPPTPNPSDPASHDKIYYDDRYNESAFDPSLARSSLPKILISIGGMLFTGFFLNKIIVREHFEMIIL